MRHRSLRALGLGGLVALALSGCSKESAVEQETKITTPDGEATITRETTVETSGANPPVVTPADAGATTATPTP